MIHKHAYNQLHRSIDTLFKLQQSSHHLLLDRLVTAHSQRNVLYTRIKYNFMFSLIDLLFSVLITHQLLLAVSCQTASGFPLRTTSHYHVNWCTHWRRALSLHITQVKSITAHSTVHILWKRNVMRYNSDDDGSQSIWDLRWNTSTSRYTRNANGVRWEYMLWFDRGSEISFSDHIHTRR